RHTRSKRDWSSDVCSSDLKKVKYLLLSGDNRSADYDEPTAMRAGLIKRGVPAEAIYRDFAGLRTRDSVLRAQSVFGQKRLIIVRSEERRVGKECRAGGWG